MKIKEKIGSYRKMIMKGNFEDVYYSLKEDIDEILDIPSQRRSLKQRKLLDYLRQLERLTKKRKKDLAILYKIAKLL